jgi:bifunctional DNase/RNase
MTVELELSRIIINELSDRQVVYLRERQGHRRLPITIGVFEAHSIDRFTKRMPAPRPLSHQLIVATALQLGGEFQDLVITKLQDDTFYAVLRVKRDGRLIDVDCRPSDGIAVAMACDPPLPIYAAEEVLQAVKQG